MNLNMLCPNIYYYANLMNRYCNYVEVTTTGAHIPCAQELFTVEQWLATDTSPYELTAIKNSCASEDHADRFAIHGSGSAPVVSDV